MRIVLFAHVPPPHHGQSYMVELLLNGLGGNFRKKGGSGDAHQGPTFFHVNARLSEDIEEIGRASGKKLLRLLGFVGQALWCRVRYRANYLFYVPAPPVKAAIYRDWVVLGLCRPFFTGVIYHWHAIGLAEWLAKARPWERWLTQLLVGRPTLSIVLGEYCRGDAEQFRSKSIRLVPNGVPDPCPNFHERIEPLRVARARARRAALQNSQPVIFKVVYIGLCFREKGLFDLLEAIAEANSRLRRLQPNLRIELTVAGKFLLDSEKVEFESRIAAPDLSGLVNYVGFVGGAAKSELLIESDCLAFPTFYSAESFGLVLLEAMAHGLPVIATRWRTIPEVLPPGYAGLVEPHAPSQVADALLNATRADYDPSLRARFIAGYTVERFVENCREALLSITADP